MTYSIGHNPSETYIHPVNQVHFTTVMRLDDPLHYLSCMVIFLQEIIQNDRKLRYTSDRIIMLEQEESSLKKVMEQETRHITTLETVHSTIQKLIDQSNDKTDPLTVDKAAEAFKELQVRRYRLIKPCIFYTRFEVLIAVKIQY